MAKHRRKPHRRQTKLRLAWGLTVLSIGTPVGMLCLGQSIAADEHFVAVAAEDRPTLAQVARAGREAVRTARSRSRQATPTSTAQKRSQIPISTTIPRPTTPTSSPTTAQKLVQRASSKPRTQDPPPPRVVTTPKPPVVTRTANKHSPAPAPAPAPTPSRGQRIVEIAQKYVNTGIPYAMGGNSRTNGMDCSHFVWMVLKEAGLSVPYRDSADLRGWTIRTNDPQPGDLVLYSGHVAIYLGNGMLIDQGSSGGAHLRKVFTENFIGYGRIPS